MLKRQTRYAWLLWLVVGGGRDLLELERRLVGMVNLEREARGLAPLAPLPELADVARQHSRNMAEAREVAHDAGGTTMEERIDAVFPDRCLAGENLSRHLSIDYALADWLGSEGHRANLLNPDFSGTGVGIVRGKDGLLYITQNFLHRCTHENRRRRP